MPEPGLLAIKMQTWIKVVKPRAVSFEESAGEAPSFPKLNSSLWQAVSPEQPEPRTLRNWGMSQHAALNNGPTGAHGTDGQFHSRSVTRVPH